MEQTSPLRLPAHLERAAQRVRMAARSAAEHTVDALGLAALATTQVVQRDLLLGAQYELNRKLALFTLGFNEALDGEVARQAGVLVPTARPDLTPDAVFSTWESLTLVDDHEVEMHISADRFTLEINHACEWELREFDAYMAPLLHLDAADHARNPLRAEVVAQAMMQAIDTLTPRADLRKVLASEIGRALAQAMRQTYADIVADLRQQGVRPLGPSLRAGTNSRPAPLGARTGTVPGVLAPTAPGSPSDGVTGPHGDGRASGMGRPDAASALQSLPATVPAPESGTVAQSGQPVGSHTSLGAKAEPSGGSVPAQAAPHGTAGAGQMGQVDAALMAWMRQLQAQHLPPPPTASPGWPEAADGPPAGPLWPNLIAHHRDDLRRMASAPLDHLVIDLVAGLFDQILSDAKVPPQFARQIARLQMPVLRAALGDNRFFTSRQHPVRRFVNRIASLGAACDEPEGPMGTALLAQVSERVQAIVEGAFDRADTYERQLDALDAFVAGQAAGEVQALGDAGPVLARKEDEQRAQALFCQRVDTALADLPVPDYLRAFLVQVWCRAIARTELKEGAGSPLAQRLRETGRELVMSVQPKGAPAQRQQFLRRLPQLMKDLNLGLDHARCPEPQRRALFAQLLPAHAEALKRAPLSTLEHNLLARQVEAALALPVPTPERLPPAAATPATGVAASTEAPDVPFSAAEAQAVGLVAEQAVDWQTPLDIDLSEEPELCAVDIAIDGLPEPDAPEPSRGASLADHVQIGFAYQMHLGGDWHKVKLAHVSPGRGFFVFTHGQRQRRTVTLTHRMLQRLCADRRLRAFETAYLIERATARARQQLAQLRPQAA